jgi:tellurite methyltransferase
MAVNSAKYRTMEDVTSPTSTSSAPFWDAAYANATQPDTFCGGAPSNQILEIATKLPPDAKILDLGCGDERNALYLAEQRFDVTAVDVSEAAIGAVQRFARARGLTIATAVQDHALLCARHTL